MGRRSPVARVFVTLLGVAMVLWAISSIMLGVIGAQATAQITSVRRQGGERTDGRPGRYTYEIGYTFRLPSGKTIHGSTTRIADAIYVKVEDPFPLRQVRYLKQVPWVNALEEDTRPGLGQVVLLVAGGLLFYAMIKR